MLLLWCLWANPQQSYAWGDKGHKIIAKIAYSRLTPPVRDSVALYLDSMPFEEAANWMNAIKSKHSYDYMRPWHYIDLDKNEKYDSTKKDNLIWILNKAIYELEHREDYSKDDIALDLRVVLFLVGSIHQPLHVGYGFDRGGLDVPLYFRGLASDLHKVWNNEIIDMAVSYDPASWCNTNKYSPEQIREIEQTDVIKWMNETRKLLPEVYDFQDHKIPASYIVKNTAVIKTQLLYAGIRLSHLLETIFAKK